MSLAALLYEPPFSLVHQSWAPREQRHGTVNVDGFGVGWYALDVRREPARYRRAGPIWADRSLASLAGVIASGCVVAAVRSATPPSPSEESGAAPFTDGPWLFSLNGAVAGDVADAVALRRSLSDRRGAGLEGASDAETLFGWLLDRLDECCDPAAALVSCVSSLRGRLNLLLADGHTVWATAWGDTLYRRPWCGGTVIASEPFDDEPGWLAVPDRSLVVAQAGVGGPDAIQVTPISGGASDSTR